MRNILLSVLLTVSMYVNAQDSTKNSFNYSYGYFPILTKYSIEIDVNNPKIFGKIHDGYGHNIQYQRQLKTGFIIKTGIYQYKSKSYFNDILGLYWDTEFYEHYFIADISFGIPLIKQSRHSLIPALGLFFENYRSLNVNYEVDADETGIYLTSIPAISSQNFKDLGISFRLDYQYNFHNNFFIGVGIFSNLIFSVGIETVAVLPCFGYSF